MGKIKTTPNSSNKITIKRLLYGVVGGVLAVSLGGVGYAFYYANRVLPHTVVAGMALGGKTLPEAVEAVQAASESLTGRYLTLRSGDQTAIVHPADIALVIDAKTTAAAAFALGKRDDFWTSAGESTRALYHPVTVAYHFSYDQAKLEGIIADFAAGADKPEVNAGVKIEKGKVIETQGVSGERIDQAAVADQIIERWRTGAIGEMNIPRHEVAPVIASGETKIVKDQADKVRALKINVTLDDKAVSPKQASVDAWITSEVNTENKLQVTFNREAVKTWLGQVSGQLNSDVQEAKLAISDGKVTIFQVGKVGKVIDQDKTADSLILALRDYINQGLKDKQINVSATANISKPQVNDQSIESLGINELIGTASTSFVGSPDNRKHNIAVGAAALNGILVKPGDEFSTLRYLGKIDGASGYLPELVIKEDKTTPEFGGGLCQVSTTLFRATMNSGLKVTERRNHSYRVGYYEPPVGMDATIYEGSPDFKFVNDTPSNILIQSHIEGTKLSFDFYGQKDGRTVSMTTPVMGDIKPPPDPEYIPTDTLPEGTTKQTEKAHNGANASFTYTVSNSDGSVRNQQTFQSHYVPWQARYLVGTAKVDNPDQQPTP